jgi:hypothetical protein
MRCNALASIDHTLSFFVENVLYACNHVIVINTYSEYLAWIVVLVRTVVPHSVTRKELVRDQHEE